MGYLGPGATPPHRSALGPHRIGNSGASAGTGGDDGFESFAGQRRSTPTTSDGEAVRIRVRVSPPDGCRGPLPLPTRQVVAEDRLALRPSWWSSPPRPSRVCPRWPCPLRAPSAGPQRSLTVNSGRQPCRLSCVIPSSRVARVCFPSSRYFRAGIGLAVPARPIRSLVAEDWSGERRSRPDGTGTPTWDRAGPRVIGGSRTTPANDGQPTAQVSTCLLGLAHVTRFSRLSLAPEEVTELPRSLPAACPRRKWPPDAGLTPFRKVVPEVSADRNLGLR